MAKDAKSTRIRRGARRTCSSEQRAAELHALELVAEWLKNAKQGSDEDYAAQLPGTHTAYLMRGQWLAFDAALIHVQGMMAQRRRAK